MPSVQSQKVGTRRPLLIIRPALPVLIGLWASVFFPFHFPLLPINTVFLPALWTVPGPWLCPLGEVPASLRMQTSASELMP